MSAYTQKLDLSKMKNFVHNTLALGMKITYPGDSFRLDESTHNVTVYDAEMGVLSVVHLAESDGFYESAAIIDENGCFSKNEL